MTIKRRISLRVENVSNSDRKLIESNCFNSENDAAFHVVQAHSPLMLEKIKMDRNIIINDIKSSYNTPVHRSEIKLSPNAMLNEIDENDIEFIPISRNRIPFQKTRRSSIFEIKNSFQTKYNSKPFSCYNADCKLSIKKVTNNDDNDLNSQYNTKVKIPMDLFMPILD